MNHRPLAAIKAERAEVEARLQELLEEQEAARRAEIDAVVRLFDAGLSFRQIGRKVGQTSAAVQGIVFRSGRTVAGRTAICHQIDVAAAPAQATQ